MLHYAGRAVLQSEFHAAYDSLQRLKNGYVFGLDMQVGLLPSLAISR